MKMKTFNLGTMLILCSISATSNGQVVTGRTTSMNWDSLYGGGPTSFQPFEVFSDSGAVPTFTKNLNFSDFQQGDYPLSWSASVSIDITQTFEITGSLNSFETISGSLYGTKSQASGGQIGSAGISSVLPGNELLIDFVVDSAMNYTFSGDWHSTVANSSWVALAVFNGASYVGVHDTRQLFLGNSGVFDWSGSLGPGSYRLISQNELNGGYDNFSGENNFNFTNVDAVPEPSTIALFALCSVALSRKKLQKSR